METRSKRKRKGEDGDIKLRRCLICGQEFASEWAGNRICNRCKSTSSWRAGG